MTTLSPVNGETDLRRLYGRFPTGVTVLCGMAGARPIGMTASAFVAVSLNPPLVSVCIQHGSTTWMKLRECRRVGISFLTQEQEAVARQLASRAADRFTGLEYFKTPHDAVLLTAATAWLECEVENVIPAGDHDIVLFQLVATSVLENEDPLIFYASRFRPLQSENR